MIWRTRRFFSTRIIFLVLFCLLFVVGPAWVVLVNSLKTTGEAALMSAGLPSMWNGLENYGRAFTEGRFARGFVNTIIVVFPAIAITILIATMAGWTFARSRSRTTRLLYYVFICPVIIPPAILPTLFVLKAVGIQGSQLGLAIFYAAAFLGLAIFVVTGFVKTIPVEVEEAAQIDGAGVARIFSHIAVPLLAPGLTALALIMLILLWNDFFWPIFLLNSSSAATLTLGLFNFISAQSFSTRWELVFAHIVLLSVPLLVVFTVAQRRIVEGITAGGVK